MLLIGTWKSTIINIQSIIDLESRLNEVVKIINLDEGNLDNCFFRVTDQIELDLRINNEVPPFILPNKIEFNNDNFLSLVYLYLNNFEKAYQFAKEPLLYSIDMINRLQHGILIKWDEVKKEDQFENMHNAAILAHYGNPDKLFSFDDIFKLYEKAFRNHNIAGQFRAFTGQHFTTFLLDSGQLLEAENIVIESESMAISNSMKCELDFLLYGIWLSRLTKPYDDELKLKIKNKIANVLCYFEKQNDFVQQAMVMIDAAHIANLENSFTEALSFVSKAIQILDEENIPELMANAQYRKGLILFTWAQKANPQFFKPAMEAYQKALKVFTAENTPEVFAEIQHHLGVIYSEIPDEIKVKSMWAAVSISSFNSALEYFTPQTHPYEYAVICNNYGNAFTKYPDAVKSDNYSKALNLYRKALEIRTSDEFPTERALTILNFLEASFFADYADNEAALYNEMNAYLDEIPKLTQDPEILESARRQREKLELVKNALV